MERWVDLGGWLHIPRWFTCTQADIHPSTNRARRRAITLFGHNALPLRHAPTLTLPTLMIGSIGLYRRRCECGTVSWCTRWPLRVSAVSRTPARSTDVPVFSRLLSVMPRRQHPRPAYSRHPGQMSTLQHRSHHHIDWIGAGGGAPREHVSTQTAETEADFRLRVGANHGLWYLWRQRLRF